MSTLADRIKELVDELRELDRRMLAAKTEHEMDVVWNDGARFVDATDDLIPILEAAASTAALAPRDQQGGV